MFVNIVEFPQIKKGKDEEFRKWSAKSLGKSGAPAGRLADTGLLRCVNHY